MYGYVCAGFNERFIALAQNRDAKLIILKH